jgi:hypothetical protein
VLLAVGATLQREPWTGEHLLAFTSASARLVAAASTEELLFRGYGWAWTGAAAAGLAHRAGAAPRSAAALGFGVVSALCAGGFGLAHLANDGATPLSSLNTALAGAWLLVLALRTRALWAPIAAHWSWNCLCGLILGFPVSGTELPALWRASSPGGPAWLHGGAYGVEGSVACTVVLVLATALAALFPRRPPAEGSSALDGRWRTTAPGPAPSASAEGSAPARSGRTAG